MLDTTDGPMSCAQVVVCAGAYRVPHRPVLAGAFPPHITVLDATSYRGPASLRESGVLVVGSGQTGVQLAEELHASGRPVTLACGRAPWLPRRAAGQDIVTWLERTSYFEQRLVDLPEASLRLGANAQLTGAGGGHDLHFRVLQQQGVTLAGRLTDVRDGRATFADDLADSVAFGDPGTPTSSVSHRRARRRRTLPARAGAVRRRGAVRARPGWHRHGGPTAGFRRTTPAGSGFPVFDALGFPVVGHDLATAVPGLFFCGVHFLRNRRSSLLWGVGADAAVVADTLVRRR